MNRLRKILCTAAGAALTVVLATGAASAAFGTGAVTASSLYLRAEPGTSARILGGAPRGASVEILSDAQNGWYHVNYNGKTGYMSAEYLRVTPAPAPAEATVVEPPVALCDEPEALPEEPAQTDEAPAEQPSEAPDPVETAEPAGADEAPLCAMVTARSSLNVRSGPGYSYGRVGSLPAWTTVTVLEKGSGWSKVTNGAITGYATNEYLRFTAMAEMDGASSAAGAAVVDHAVQFLGCRYVSGGASPSTGFDCSGFVSYIYKSLGYPVPRTGNAMWADYPHVADGELQPGDVVCFTKTTNSSSYITHVGLYIGDGQFIHASTSKTGVIFSSLSEHYYATRYVGAVRIV